MTKINKKFMALAAAAALGVAGVAYAAVNSVTIINAGNTGGGTGVGFLQGSNASEDIVLTTGGTIVNGLGLDAARIFTVTLEKDAVLSILPGTEVRRGGAPISEAARIAGATAATGLVKDGLGTLRIAAGNNNDPLPSAPGTWNDFAGKVDVKEGTLALHHSNAIGSADLTLRNNTTLLIDNRDMALGGQYPDGSNNPGQNITVDNSLKTANGKDSRSPVFFDVVDNREFGARKKIIEVPNGDGIGIGGIQLNKIGVGLMTITNAKGSVHTGGTVVAAGTLDMLADGSTASSRYDTPLGNVWLSTLDPAKDIYAENSGAYINANVGYNSRPAFDNRLQIDAGATLRVNRDKAFGSFNGAGNFVSNAYNNGVRPFITVWNNNDAASNDVAFNSAFSGNITGAMNFVLDARAQEKDDTSHYPLALALQTLRLTGANNWDGETWVVDGILSAKDVNSVGTGMIRVGFDNKVTPGNNLNDRTYTTQNAATLHFSNETVVPNKTVTEINAGLGADDRATVTYNDVEVYNTLAVNPFRSGSKTAPVNYQGTVKFDKNIRYAGTIGAPTKIDVERGRLQLWAMPAGSDDFAEITVQENARLGFGPNIQNMIGTYNVVMKNVASLEGYITPNNVKTTHQFQDLYDSAIMRFNGFDVTALGEETTQANKYIKVKLIRDNTTAIHAGSYIPIISARNFIGQAALYDVPTATHKVRPYVENLDNNNLESIYLEVDTKTYDGVVYAKVIKDIPPVKSDDPTPPTPISPDSGGSSGCSTGAFAGLAGLLLAPLAFLRKKD